MKEKLSDLKKTKLETQKQLEALDEKISECLKESKSNLKKIPTEIINNLNKEYNKTLECKTINVTLKAEISINSYSLIEGKELFDYYMTEAFDDETGIKLEELSDVGPTAKSEAKKLLSKFNTFKKKLKLTSNKYNVDLNDLISKVIEDEQYRDDEDEENYDDEEDDEENWE